jgi:hypothetical protein
LRSLSGRTRAQIGKPCFFQSGKRIAEKNNEREFFKLPGLGIEPGTKRFFVYTPLPLSLSHSAARSVVNFYSVTIVREWLAINGKFFFFYLSWKQHWLWSRLSKFSTYVHNRLRSVNYSVLINGMDILST